MGTSPFHFYSTGEGDEGYLGLFYFLGILRRSCRILDKVETCVYVTGVSTFSLWGQLWAAADNLFCVDDSFWVFIAVLAKYMKSKL